jgi:hypothetical protein
MLGVAAENAKSRHFLYKIRNGSSKLTVAFASLAEIPAHMVNKILSAYVDCVTYIKFKTKRVANGTAKGSAGPSSDEFNLHLE